MNRPSRNARLIPGMILAAVIGAAGGFLARQPSAATPQPGPQRQAEAPDAPNGTAATPSPSAAVPAHGPAGHTGNPMTQATTDGTSRPAILASAPGFSLHSLDTPNGTIRWALYIPENAREPMPLIVFLHGRGESGTDGTRQLAVGLGPALMLQRERWPAAVIFPQKPTQESLWPAHYDAVMQMIEITRLALKIDENRISLTGLSQGGNGTWEFAARNPGMWSGIAPICGFGDPALIGPAVATLPIWTFHGEKDTVIVPGRTTAIVDAVKAAGGTAKLTLYPDADHNSWDRAYRGEQLPEWLLAQRRK